LQLLYFINKQKNIYRTIYILIYDDIVIFQIAREDVTQMVPRPILSHIPLEFRNKLFSILSYRKEIQKCRNANAEKLYKYISVVL